MNSVYDYYQRRSSRWGYRLLLNGVRHFGYYPNGEYTKHRQAQYLMMQKVAKKLDLQPGAKVLDVGCGEGSTSLYFAQKYGYKMSGIDLLDESIVRARKKICKDKDPGIRFDIGSYMKLPYKTGTFDGVFALESLYHAQDLDKAVSELKRVLKPGGKLVIADYTVTKNSNKASLLIQHGAHASAGRGLVQSPHGSYQKRLRNAGFENVAYVDLTKNVMPMAVWFYRIAYLPALLMPWARQSSNHIHLSTAYNLWSFAEQGFWKYVMLSATKSIY